MSDEIKTCDCCKQQITADNKSAISRVKFKYTHKVTGEEHEVDLCNSCTFKILHELNNQR